MTSFGIKGIGPTLTSLDTSALTHVPAGQQIAFEDHAHPHSGRLDAHVRPVEIKNEVFMPAADLVPRQPVAPVN